MDVSLGECSGTLHGRVREGLSRPRARSSTGGLASQVTREDYLSNLLSLGIGLRNFSMTPPPGHETVAIHAPMLWHQPSRCGSRGAGTTLCSRESYSRRYLRLPPLTPTTDVRSWKLQTQPRRFGLDRIGGRDHTFKHTGQQRVACHEKG